MTRCIYGLVAVLASVTAAAAPKLSLNGGAQSGLRLSFIAETGRVYRIEQAASLGGTFGPFLTLTAQTARIETPISRTGLSKFFRVAKEANVDGALQLTDGQSLSGIVPIGVHASVASTQVVSFVELVDIDASGNAKRIAYTDEPGFASGFFHVNTALYPNGPHMLQLRVQEYDRDADVWGYYEESAPVTVTFANATWFEDPPVETGFRLALSFASAVPEGDWEVRVRAPDGSVFREASDDLASSRNGAGYIYIADAYNSDGSPRTPYNYEPYPEPYYDIEVVITPRIAPLLARIAAEFPDPTTLTNKQTNYVRTLVKSRPDFRLGIVAEQRGIIPADGTRTLFNAFMDVALTGLGQLGPHWNLLNMTYEDPLPSSEMWNKLFTGSPWNNLNMMIAGAGPAQPTMMFSFTHGSAAGMGSTATGGTNGSMTAGTLATYGYTGGSGTNITNGTFGLTFFFPDACMVASGGLIPLCLIHGSTAEMSRSKLGKNGFFPHFGCGWKKLKTVGLRNGVDIITYHADFVGNFMYETCVFDPVLGLPANTYKQADARAAPKLGIYFLVHRDFTMFGCSECYIDE